MFCASQLEWDFSGSEMLTLTPAIYSQKTLATCQETGILLKDAEPQLSSGKRQSSDPVNAWNAFLHSFCVWTGGEKKGLKDENLHQMLSHPQNTKVSVLTKAAKLLTSLKQIRAQPPFVERP